MEDAWQIIKPYVDETEELRNEIRVLKRMMEAANAAFAALAERHVRQCHVVENQQQRLDDLYTKLQEVFGEI